MITLTRRVDVAEKMRTAGRPQESPQIAEARAILAANTKEDIKLLQTMGLGKALDQKASWDNSEQEIKCITDHDGTNIYTAEEVRKMCVKYRFECHKAERYIGSIGTTLPMKLRALEKMIGTLDKDRLYIAAPSNKFVPDLDPIAFYKLKTGDLYMVDKWGGDLVLTPFTMLKNFFLRNGYTSLLGALIFGFALFRIFLWKDISSIVGQPLHGVFHHSDYDTECVTLFSAVTTFDFFWLCVSTIVFWMVSTINSSQGKWVKP